MQEKTEVRSFCFLVVSLGGIIPNEHNMCRLNSPLASVCQTQGLDLINVVVIKQFTIFNLCYVSVVWCFAILKSLSCL